MPRDVLSPSRAPRKVSRVVDASTAVETAPGERQDAAPAASVSVIVPAYNERATIVADLGREGSLPGAAFECIIVTQTLQHVAHPAAALKNLWSALAPGCPPRR